MGKVYPKRKSARRSRAFRTATESLSRRLRTWREKEELTQRDVADAIGVSLQTISHWEQAVRFPSGENMDKLAKFMKTPVCGLIYFDADACPLCRRHTTKSRKR